MSSVQHEYQYGICLRYVNHQHSTIKLVSPSVCIPLILEQHLVCTIDHNILNYCVAWTDLSQRS